MKNSIEDLHTLVSNDVEQSLKNLADKFPRAQQIEKYVTEKGPNAFYDSVETGGNAASSEKLSHSSVH